MGKNLQDELQRCIFSLDFSSKTVTLKFFRTSSQQRLECYLAGFYIYPVATPSIGVEVRDPDHPVYYCHDDWWDDIAPTYYPGENDD